ncbi:MAG: hypothetical protein ACE5NA_12175 [Nitrospiraceae bacterium]
MFVWSKHVVVTLLVAFAIFMGLFLMEGLEAESSMLKPHTTFWITLNFAGLVIWIFVWMIDQARVRGRNVWLWLVPFVFAPLPVLMAFILLLQRKVKT